MIERGQLPRPERNLPGATNQTYHEKEGHVEPGTPKKTGWFERLRGKAEEREVTDSSGRVVGTEIVRRVADDALETTIEVQHVVEGKLTAISRTVVDKKTGRARSYERRTPDETLLRQVIVDGDAMTDTEYRYGADLKTDTLPDITITQEFTDGTKTAASEVMFTYDGEDRPIREDKLRLPTQPEDWIGTNNQNERKVRRYETTTERLYMDDSVTTASTTKGFPGTDDPPKRGRDDREEVGVLIERTQTQGGERIFDIRQEIAVQYELISTPGPGGQRNERIERTENLRLDKMETWEPDKKGRLRQYALIKRSAERRHKEVVDYTYDTGDRLLTETLTRNDEEDSKTTYEYRGEQEDPSFKEVEDAESGEVTRYRRRTPQESSKLDVLNEDALWEEVK